MCGIVGLYLKNRELEPQLGRLFEPMLCAMCDRGSDSAGFAIYGDEVPAGQVKFTLQQGDTDYDWETFFEELKRDLTSGGSAGRHVEWFRNASAAVLKTDLGEEKVREWVLAHHPEVYIMSVGRSIEILKGVGSPQEIAARFDLAGMQGTHIIGHTRMATESAVNLEGSHPFSTGMDLCLVHNGSLSNHNRLRQKLWRHGIRFETENDTEVAAGYLTWKLREGFTLTQALEAALKDLDGFYTFTVGTRDGFAVVRDPIACKPAVMAETEDYVAMASEYRALATLPGADQAQVWEPRPGRVYVWEREKEERLSA